MYTARKWQEIVAEVAKLDIKDEKARRYQRDMLSKVQEIPDCDQQGRILITPNMKKLANLEKRLLLLE